MRYLVLMLRCNLNSFKSPFTELSIYLDLIEGKKTVPQLYASLRL